MGVLSDTCTNQAPLFGWVQERRGGGGGGGEGGLELVHG